MQKLVLLITLYLGSFYFATAQSPNPNYKEAVSRSIDTSLRNTPGQSGSRNILAKPESILNDLFESESMDLQANRGPRLNPRAVSFVEDYIDKNGESLNKMKDWAKPFFNMMDGIFLKHSLPRELKYLAVIESRLNPTSTSWAGAVGPWQFMPATAIRMGLKVNRYVDERKNYIKSTEAAARYLTELYEQFGDWLLVIAAYNSGPGHVLKAIRVSKSRNFWDIQYYLPSESRSHVKKFIGTHYIFEGQGGLTTLTRAESDDHYGENGISAMSRKLNETEIAASKEQRISGKYHSMIIAKNIVMDIAEFNRYNPGFDKTMASADNTYELRLPAEKMQSFNAHKYQILNESIQLMLTHAASVKEVSAKSEKSVTKSKKK
jgi:membrane-bound lytic murein transglycosylase D